MRGNPRALLGHAPRLVLAVVAIGLMAATPRFFTAGTASTILALASIVGILAVGQAYALIGGGFDLAQGATLALVAGVAAFFAGPQQANPWLVATGAVALGGLLGAVNGVFVGVIGTNPFVATLSTLLVYRGAAFVWLEGQPIRGVTAFSGLSRELPLLGGTVPVRGLIFLGVALVGAFLLRRTVFGRHVYALGGNAEAARLSGIATRRLKVVTFAVSGAAAGLAAVLLLSWVRVAKPDTAVGYELDAIAACVVGGISLQGGRGGVLGAALGCLLLQALGTWITIRGFQDEYRNLLTGAVILTFASIDALGRKR
jgi:ribose transport system permease protein